MKNPDQHRTGTTQMSSYRTAFCLVLGCLIAGCSNLPRLHEVPLPIAGAPIEIYATQQEVETETSNTNPAVAGGGLLGLLIVSVADNVVNRRAEAAVSGIRDNLVHYSISERFLEKLQNAEVDSQLSTGGELVIHREARLPADDLLGSDGFRLRPRVLFSTHMQMLIVKLDLAKVIREGREGRLPRYQDLLNLEFIWHVNGNWKTRRDEAAAIWAAMPAEDLIALVERGMDTTIRMMKARFEEPIMGLRVVEPRLELPGVAQRARQWRSDGDMLWVAHGPENSRVYAILPEAFDRR